MKEKIHRFYELSEEQSFLEKIKVYKCVNCGIIIETKTNIITKKVHHRIVFNPLIETKTNLLNKGNYYSDISNLKGTFIYEKNLKHSDFSEKTIKIIKKKELVKNVNRIIWYKRFFSE